MSASASLPSPSWTNIHLLDCPRILITAPSSGAGKTSLSLGLMTAFTRRGMAVQPFKAGPDYMDSALHAASRGRPAGSFDPKQQGRRGHAAVGRMWGLHVSLRGGGRCPGKSVARRRGGPVVDSHDWRSMALALTKGGSPVGPDGFARGSIFAAYLHVHFAGNMGAARRFTTACEAYARKLTAPNVSVHKLSARKATARRTTASAGTNQGAPQA